MPLKNLSPEAKATIAQKIVVPLVGISCVGKNTLMDAIVKAYPEFHRVSGFTTRKRHPDEPEDTYREYLQNDEATCQALLTATGEDELVQYEQHPTTGNLYGTTMRDYAGIYNVKDVLSDAIPTFRDLGFAACNVVVVVVEPEQWQARFDAKNLSDEDRAKRISEGIKSLTWALTESPEPLWLANPNGELGYTVVRLEHLAKGLAIPHEEDTIETAQRLRKHLQSLGEQ